MIEYVIAAKEDMELLMQSSLDATPSGRPLYEKCGFAESEECMVLNLL